MLSSTEPSEPQVSESFAPWVPPGAPPSTRLRDAARPLLLIGLAAVAVALVVRWLAAPEPPPETVAGPTRALTSAPLTPASLLVDADPTETSIWIDGDSVGVAPVWLSEIQPGRVVVGARTDGQQRDTTLMLQPGEDAEVWIQMAPGGVAREPATASQVIEARDTERPAEERAAAPRPAPASRSVPRRPSPTPQPTTSSSDAGEPLAPAPATGQLRITSLPSGASVWIGSENRGTTPLLLDGFPAGDHRIEVRLQGYEPERLRLTVAPGALTSETVALSTRPGIVTIASEAGARVFVDGRPQGTVGDDPLRLSLPAGSHELLVVHRTRGEARRVVDVTAGTTLRLSMPLQAAPRDRRGW